MSVQGFSRPLLLSGFMATGKTTVGRLVAQAVGVDFVDLDEMVEQQTGVSVAELFAREGEAAFRKLERAALRELLAQKRPLVVALGGGALLHSPTRLLALEQAVVVTLNASLEVLLARAQGDVNVRPLLRGGDEEHVRMLLDLRRPAYCEAHAIVDTSVESPEVIARAVAAVWQRDPIAVAAKENSYVVDIGRGFAPAAVARAVAGAPLTLLITDDTVGALYADAYREAFAVQGTRHCTHSVSPGEEHKSPGTLEAIWKGALANGADRGLRVVGLGGGVVTDIAGFAAATWMRGVTWFSVPTTLLGMVDASVGGKTAVDLPLAKNCVGAFWQPRQVFCDVEQLRTEPLRGYTGALAEVVKTALLGDADLFTLLERESASIRAFDIDLVELLVRRCIAVKASIVSQDERESGLRAALNLGHTIGHAVESVGGFGHHTHGEAVSLGLVAALRIGVALGKTSKDLERRGVALLAALGLPTAIEAEPLADAAELLGHDKKRGGNAVKFVFCPEPGRVVFEALPIARLQELTRALARPA